MVRLVGLRVGLGFGYVESDGRVQDIVGDVGK